ncbi:MAG: diguanylate cyclase [Caenispirillum bisanense]|nr:diguanylate cyclase [Caenispirillum bisanense]MCA1974286.1 diguanylate cyclase [Caenispirillum sp.]
MPGRARIDDITTRTVEGLWGIWRGADPGLRARVASIARRDADALAEVFYDTLLRDPAAATFLSHDLVQTRLRGSMAKWLQAVFSITVEDDVRAVVATNFHVGSVHARINIPLTLIPAGMRVIKRDLTRRLVAEAPLPPAEVADAVLFIGELLDTLTDTMHEAYIGDLVGNVRHQQSLKMFMSGQNLAFESERLKGSLLDWLRTVVVGLYERGDVPPSVPSLETSDFGLWLNHKAELTFGAAPELDALRARVHEVTERVDAAIAAGGEAVGAAFVRQIDRDVTEISYLLGSITARAVEMESGRDSLTRLLTRRFMPAIFQREVAMSLRHGKPFGVLLVDADHFKKINDTHGHDCGDRVLSTLSELLMSNVRAGDFVFRYGGEEFLVLVAEMDATALVAKAEQIRDVVANHPVPLPDGRQLGVTVSIGAALHDGHPDYERIIKAADAALYEAKRRGRDRVVLAGAAD